MKMIFWLAYKMLLGNLRRAIFPFLGVVGGISALVLSLALGDGGERMITTNLMAIGNNRIMLGGDELSKRDIQILENYPFVDYAFFPEARKYDGNNIFRGYSKKALMAMGLNSNLGNMEVILDKNQFPDVGIGERIELITEAGRKNFIVADLYEEKNPFELTRQGNRIIVSQDYFGKLFGIYRFKEIVVSFFPNEDSEDLIPIILQKFNSDRRGINQIRLLETPEVYKRIIKIQKMVRNTLGALALISICLGGFGIMNLIAGGVKSRTVHIGILRAIGLSKENVTKVFLAEGIIIAISGTICGLLLGVICSFIAEKLIMIPPMFKVLKIVIYLVIALSFGIGIGIFPAKKAGEMNVTEALREN